MEGIFSNNYFKSTIYYAKEEVNESQNNLNLMNLLFIAYFDNLIHFTIAFYFRFFKLGEIFETKKELKGFVASD